MSDKLEFDVAIVGGGIAGLVCGVRLAELGVRVGVLEKGEHDRYPCNARFSGGAFHVCFHEVNEDESVLADVIRERAGNAATPAYVEAMARDTRTAVKWLKAQGIKFIKAGHEAWRSNTLAPPLVAKPGLHWEGRGGDVMMRTLTAKLKEARGTLLLGTKALKLRMDGAKCVGVDVEQGGQRAAVTARHVVICDGGFQANFDMLRKHITSAPEKIKQRGAATSHGDGLRMATEVGAQTVGLDRFYGHLLSKDAMHNDTLWPFPMADHICQAAVVIDGNGRRFVDEGRGGVFIANHVAKLADPLSTSVIYDEAIWDGPARDFILPANPNLITAGATIYKSPDLAGLAQQLGVPAAALQDTVAEYNKAVDAGTTDKLVPFRSSSAHKAHPIRKAPFYAMPLCAGITYSMGGLAIDASARVLNAQNSPIAGLYAAGCTTGGLEGGDLVGYVGGLAKSAVMALRAAEHIAESK